MDEGLCLSKRSERIDHQLYLNPYPSDLQQASGRNGSSIYLIRQLFLSASSRASFVSTNCIPPTQNKCHLFATFAPEANGSLLHAPLLRREHSENQETWNVSKADLPSARLLPRPRAINPPILPQETRQGFKTLVTGSLGRRPCYKNVG